LEEIVSQRYEPTILTWIKKMFKYAEERHWYETYWAFDIHGTISKPDYRKSEKKIIYYPYAKETLQLMSKRKDIIMFLFTSSYPDEVKIYEDIFLKDDIVFNYTNENPDISDAKGSFGYYEQKPYFNVFLEDKAGFNPERNWKFLYDYFKNTKYKPDPKWSMKYKESYHNE
jgi:hypothetical protein